MFITFEAEITPNGLIKLPEKYRNLAARLYAQLRRAGTPINDADILIAAIALENDCVLVTNNVRHFNRISGLTVENWKTSLP